MRPLRLKILVGFGSRKERKERKGLFKVGCARKIIT
jgi:hypothetical protein